MTGTDPLTHLPKVSTDDLDTRLRSEAQTVGLMEVILRPETSGTFSERVNSAQRSLRKLEEIIAHEFQSSAPADDKEDNRHPLLKELRANHRILRSSLAAVTGKHLRIESYPRIVLDSRDEVPRIALAMKRYFRVTEGVFKDQSLCTFINALQSYAPLTLNELWSLPAFLSFVLLESILAESHTFLSIDRSISTSPIEVRLKSLRAVSTADWQSIIEPLILLDGSLRQDPAAAYSTMDFESREFYRKRIAYIARHSDCTESQVALEALRLAQQAAASSKEKSRVELRRSHVGYYLVEKGFPQLLQRVGFHPPISWRMRSFVRAHAEDFYIAGVWLLTISFIAAAFFPVLVRFSSISAVLVAIAFLLLPASQDAVDLVNHAVTAFFEPDPLAKLDFSKGIPGEHTTLLAVPSLLLNERQVRKLVADLEVRYLANRDANLHFALLSDLPDSISKPGENDTHPLVDLAIQLIDSLNAKYAHIGKGAFLLLHRRRIFNVRQGVWMGWERKRGKLLDLNKFLIGEYDAFPIKAGKIDVLHNVRYILTVDSDTQLPRDTAARLVGTMAHPLNRAVIDPEKRIVTDGYGILQPRISITVQSAVRSRLAAIFSGQNGFDIYTRAVSDAYQDLFNEGIFTGKGIYEVEALHAVLNNRFPRNSLLSHDLIEGAYGRAGLVTDAELIEDYPSHYSAYSRRQHRWLRGDWQITQWMFARVPNESGKFVQNPISDINRWKIFDNLRRSLVDPFLFLLFVAGWLGLPGSPRYWTIVALVLLFFPILVQFVFALGRALTNSQKGRISDAFLGVGHAALITLLQLTLLPHKMLLAFDAIVRVLIRRFITGKRLLEWETAAQAESIAGNRSPVDRYLIVTPLIAVGLAVLIWFVTPHYRALPYAAPILILWFFSTIVASWLNRSPHPRKQISSDDEEFLLFHALRIWRYFHQFSSETHNYLIPDNVEEEGLVEAARVSPTNIGMLLNARLAAYKLGFITTPEFSDLTQRSLATIARLEKFRGHLYNWYDTKTLKTLHGSPFVSTVDSGNFVAALYTLHSGATDIASKHLISQSLFLGLRVHWRFLCSHSGISAKITKLPLPASAAAPAKWIEWLPLAEAALDAARTSASTLSENAWCMEEAGNRIRSILSMLRDYMPWTLPEYAPLREIAQLGLDGNDYKLTIEEAILFAEILSIRLIQADDKLVTHSTLSTLSRQLHAALGPAADKLRCLSNELHKIAEDTERLAEETEFGFLVDPGRKILSIGYDMGTQKRHEACYDMLASEARMASFLAIARGELPQQGWFKLTRDHVYAYGRFLLLSWTGTMFEYLMPALWMRSYPGTLISHTQTATVHVQRAFARSLNLPWGISESGAAARNGDGHYHYQAYGVPSIALSTEATEGPVISPYSTFLTLSIDGHAALRNLRRMAAAKWTGAFGMYEAADYMASRRTPLLVREWMAHHQGMSLLAIVNYLCENVVQQWFHANPLIQSAELLLHEMLARKSLLREQWKELAPLRAIRQ